MGQFLYTVVCRYYTINGIIELDLYDVLRRLHINPNDKQLGHNELWGYYGLIWYHVHSGQAVEYVIKKVLREIDITEETRQFYSQYTPYSIMYDCKYDLKDVSRMNQESINLRMEMTDKEFYKVYGGKVK